MKIKKVLLWMLITTFVLVIVFVILKNVNVTVFSQNNVYYEDTKSNTKNISKNSNQLEILNNNYITIDKIGINNEIIKEGVDELSLKNNICHFPTTPSFNGNVCLAAHNYSINTSNLFRDLNILEIGDTICYSSNDLKREYRVNKILVINSNDFSVLDNTDKNTITLLTCIQGNNKIRLCIKAEEIKEEL